MHVGDLMACDVRTCSAGDSLNRAARIMWENDCGVVPVIDAERRLVGMITDRDVCMAAYTQGCRLEESRISSAMSKFVRGVWPEDSLAQAAETMRIERVRRLPVVDIDNRLVGLISLSDLACRAVRERPSAANAISVEDVGVTLAAISVRRTAPSEGPPEQPEEHTVLASATPVGIGG